MAILETVVEGEFRISFVKEKGGRDVEFTLFFSEGQVSMRSGDRLSMLAGEDDSKELGIIVVDLTHAGKRKRVFDITLEEGRYLTANEEADDG